MNAIARRITSRAGALLLVSLLLAPMAGAAPQPEAAAQPLISYQGTLTDENGEPIDTTVTMTFALYNAGSGGTMKWGTETQTVQVVDGLFNVLLGSVLPINPANLTGDLWLEIVVNGETLAPRERVAGVLHGANGSSDPFVVSGVIRSSRPPDPASAGALDLENPQTGNRWFTHVQAWNNDRLCFAFYDASSGILADRGGVDRDGNWSATGDLWVTGGLHAGSAGIAGDVWGNGSIFAAGHLTAGANVSAAANLTAGGSMAVSGGGSFGGDVNMNGHSIINCGALTEANLQTAGEQAAGGSERFEEGDVLCWGVDRLEKCSMPNDRLVQAVADSAGRPIVIGAEVVKVLGPVKRGAYLVASGVPGYAMASLNPTFGIVIAQALEDFEGGRGRIKAMIRKM